MIELGKTYKDGNGNDARIVCTDRAGDYPVIGLLRYATDHESIATYTATGMANLVAESTFDLIIPEDYSTYKIDEPVMVRDHDNEVWLRRYFAGVKADKPCAWDNGATSWSVSSPDHMLAWEQCRRPTTEELEVRNEI